MNKRNKWGKRILAFTLAAGMTAASVPAYAAPVQNNDGGKAAVWIYRK